MGVHKKFKDGKPLFLRLVEDSKNLLKSKTLTIQESSLYENILHACTDDNYYCFEYFDRCLMNALGVDSKKFTEIRFSLTSKGVIAFYSQNEFSTYYLMRSNIV